MNLINTRDGGVNGVKLTWDEGETQYEVENGVEVYERLKSQPEHRRLEPALGRHRLRHDRPDHRGQGAADHRQPRPHRLHRRPGLPLRLPAAAQPLQRDLGHRELHRLARRAGVENLKGKKIVVLYHGSPYGKETIPIYELLAEKYGFEVEQIEVPHPGNEQQAQWLQIRRERPDYVVLRGWGVMNPVALKTAQKERLPGRPHHRQRLVELRGGRASRRRRGHGLHRDHHPGLGQGLSGAPGDRSRRSTAPAWATSRTRSGSARSTTTSASSTASSTSRRCASPRRSSATAR